MRQVRTRIFFGPFPLQFSMTFGEYTNCSHDTVVGEQGCKPVVSAINYFFHLTQVISNNNDCFFTLIKIKNSHRFLVGASRVKKLTFADTLFCSFISFCFQNRNEFSSFLSKCVLRHARLVFFKACKWNLGYAEAISRKHQKFLLTKSFGTVKQKTNDGKSWCPLPCMKFFETKNF